MKAQKIYDFTMALMDEMLDQGGVDVNSTKDYKARAPGILTILQNELSEDVLDPVKDMNTDIDLEDKICMAVLPYGLAARLLAQEDAALSNYFSSLYETNKAKLNRKAEIVERPDVYGSYLRAGD